MFCYSVSFSYLNCVFAFCYFVLMKVDPMELQHCYYCIICILLHLQICASYITLIWNKMYRTQPEVGLICMYFVSYVKNCQLSIFLQSIFVHRIISIYYNSTNRIPSCLMKHVHISVFSSVGWQASFDTRLSLCSFPRYHVIFVEINIVLSYLILSQTLLLLCVTAE